MKNFIAAIVALCLMPWPGPADALTDCSRAHTSVEKMLCTSPRASLADQRMALAFRGAFARISDRAQLHDAQIRWQHEVRDRCTDVECLLHAYEERSLELDDLR